MSEFQVHRETGKVRYRGPDGDWVNARTQRNANTGALRFMNASGQWQVVPSDRGPQGNVFERTRAGLGNVEQNAVEFGPVDDQAFAFLKSEDSIRSRLDPSTLSALDAGQDTPELRTALGQARQDYDAELVGEGNRQSQRVRFQQQRLENMNSPGARRVQAAAAAGQNIATFGFGDRINEALTGESRDSVRDQRRELIEEHPVTYYGSEIASFLLPGSKIDDVYRGGRNLINAARVAPQGGSRVARGGRYAARLADTSSRAALNAGVYGVTAGAANREAELGHDLTLGERADVGGDFAKIGGLFGLGGSVAYRGGHRVVKGTWTPDSVARDAATRFGASAAPEAESRMVLDAIVAGGDVDRATASSLFTIFKQSGLSADDVGAGIRRASDRVKGLLDAGDRTPLFVQALAEEFKSTPQVGRNLGRVWRQLKGAPLRDGNSAQVIQSAEREQAESLLPWLSERVGRILGRESMAAEKQALEAARRESGEMFEQGLRRVDTSSKAKSVASGYLDPADNAVDALRGMLSNPRLQAMVYREAFNEGLDAATYVQRNPVVAAQSVINKINKATNLAPDDVALASDLRDLITKASTFQTNSRRVIERVRPGQESDIVRARAHYAGIKQQQDAQDFGKRLLQAVRDGDVADDLFAEYRGYGPDAQRIAQISMRQHIDNALRTTNIDDALPTLTGLRKAGLHDFFEEALGDRGRQLSQVIRETADERRFLKDLTRKGIESDDALGANEAAWKARNLYTSNPIARTGSRVPWTATLAADFGSSPFTGGVPVATAAKAGSKVFLPKARTRENLARVLSSRSAPRLNGRVRPRDGTRAQTVGVQVEEATRRRRLPNGRFASGRTRNDGLKQSRARRTEGTNSPQETVGRIRQQANTRTERRTDRAVFRKRMTEVDAAAEMAEAQAQATRRQVAQAQRLANMEQSARQQKMRADVERTIRAIRREQRNARSADRVQALDNAAKQVERVFDVALKSTGIGASLLVIYTLHKALRIVDQSYASVERETVAAE